MKLVPTSLKTSLCAYKIISINFLKLETFFKFNCRYSRILRTNSPRRVENCSTKNCRDVTYRFKMGAGEFHQVDGSEFNFENVFVFEYALHFIY